MRVNKEVWPMMLLTGVMLLTMSCAGLPTQNWQAEAELPVPTAIYTTESGRARWELPFPGNPYVEGEWEETADGRIMHVDSLHLFLNWQRGWTEIEYMAQGTVYWTVDASSVTARIEQPVELIGVEQAAIRRRDTRLRGDYAWQEARRRSERIREIAVLWRDFAPPRLFQQARPNYPLHILFRRDNFLQYWGSTFFPEVYGWGDYWDGREEKQDSMTVRGEDIAWNVSVSEHLLPPEYTDLRNSGTLFRDFEEGLEWVYLVWVWEEFFTGIVPELRFKKE